MGLFQRRFSGRFSAFFPHSLSHVQLGRLSWGAPAPQRTSCAVRQWRSRLKTQRLLLINARFYSNASLFRTRYPHSLRASRSFAKKGSYNTRFWAPPKTRKIMLSCFLSNLATSSSETPNCGHMLPLGGSILAASYGHLRHKDSESPRYAKFWGSPKPPPRVHVTARSLKVFACSVFQKTTGVSLRRDGHFGRQ